MKKATTVRTKNLRQIVQFKASPHDVYEALMYSKKHAKFTGAPAKISRKVGGKFSIYDGTLHGKNLVLTVDKKIVQEWACDEPEWPEGHVSKVTFALSAVKGGTKLSFTHAAIPATDFANIKKGWMEYYWKPMKKMLEK